MRHWMLMPIILLSLSAPAPAALSNAQLSNVQSMVRPYAYYLEPPGYDRVREKMAAILAGPIQPLTGQADPFWPADRHRTGPGPPHPALLTGHQRVRGFRA